MSIPQVILANGVTIPQIGFGTFKVSDNAEQIVRSALDVGYRHIDAAQMYGNEAATGRAWKSTGIPRENLFITSKLDNPNHLRPQARASFDQTLVDLQTDYVDLFLIHWPMPMHYDGDFAATWHILEEFLAEGRTRAIGVSNFEPEHLERILEDCSVVPHVNQIESHPYLPNDAVHTYDRAHGIVTQAWSPLARGKAVSDPVLAQIGEGYGKSAGQVALRWALQRGDVIFPKASSVARQRENLDLFDFTVNEQDMARISHLNEGESGRVGSHPATKGL